MITFPARQGSSISSGLFISSINIPDPTPANISRNVVTITTLSGGFLVTNCLAHEQQMLSDISFSFFCRFYSKPM